ncbi:alpha/beta fold hydrolase [Sphingobium boeckii]|uniref:Pimeloyl-ACP methyl ester carboxylesterase n=1 Tax=Sphingobium boeckii TaxID=1082345 RepID=A0A7W9EEP2_9SPHN|nr:alpha/beta hydrolase [Sphingobium boeckii]MBB5686387.1 pimeloyl-ACP methyl ester carboxylesterase [Sphingobium boeckii]
MAIGIAGFVLSARNGWLKPDEADVRLRYALPQSMFVDIDGQSIHYVDEGSGDAIILVHGSYGSLLIWNDWAAALSPHYRVIRYDRPPMGLSGTDPEGRYDSDREQALIAKLADKLGVDRFVLAATSSAGEPAAAYAADHPGQVRGLILANIAAGPLAMTPPHYPLWFRSVLWADSWFGGWHPTAFWRGVLEMNFADRSKITPALVQQWTDLNNRAQGMKRQPRPSGYIPFTRTPQDLARIAVPTLLLWSDRDPEVPLETQGKKALAGLGSRDKALLVIQNCGHMMPIECGIASARKARIFMDRLSLKPS